MPLDHAASAAHLTRARTARHLGSLLSLLALGCAPYVTHSPALRDGTTYAVTAGLTAVTHTCYDYAVRDEFGSAAGSYTVCPEPETGPVPLLLSAARPGSRTPLAAVCGWGSTCRRGRAGKPCCSARRAPSGRRRSHGPRPSTGAPAASSPPSGLHPTSRSDGSARTGAAGILRRCSQSHTRSSARTRISVPAGIPPSPTRCRRPGGVGPTWRENSAYSFPSESNDRLSSTVAIRTRVTTGRGSSPRVSP
jgi:hypothetical protein